MKKIFAALFMAVLGLGLVACDKEDTPQVDPVVETITLTINFDNGLENQIVEIEKGKTYAFTTLAPEKDNYTFLGWFNGEAEYTDETIFNEDVEVVAKWEKNGGGEEIPVEPEEPVTPVEPEETPKEEGVIYIKSIASKTEWTSVSINTSEMSEIIITLNHTENANKDYDIPVNFNNFKVDGEDVGFTNLSGASYVFEHEFNIGELNVIGHNINTQTVNKIPQLRLHAVRVKDNKVETREHYLKIDVSKINLFEFDFIITTNAFDYLDNMVINYR